MLNVIQMLSDVPEWARKMGLNDESFDILEQISLHPKKKDKLLAKREYAEACGILNALEYAQDKGLIKSKLKG